MNKSLKWIVVSGLLSALLVGCTSSRIRARKEEREKVVQTSHLYCDFINGEIFPDVEVAANIEMAKHCDSEKTFSLTSYHSPSDNIGLNYCCGIPDSTPGNKDMKLTKPVAKAANSATGAAAAKPMAPSSKENADGNDFEGN